MICLPRKGIHQRGRCCHAGCSPAPSMSRPVLRSLVCPLGDIRYPYQLGLCSHAGQCKYLNGFPYFLQNFSLQYSSIFAYLHSIGIAYHPCIYSSGPGVPWRFDRLPLHHGSQSPPCTRGRYFVCLSLSRTLSIELWRTELITV